MKYLPKSTFIILLAMSLLLPLSSQAWSAIKPSELFMLASTEKSMDAVLESVKKYTAKMKWVYLGDFRVKKNQVILVKFCVKAAGKKAWKAGLKVSAMLPCGNLGIYQQHGKTELSILNPYYMTTLYPDQNLTAAADLLMPLFTEMLEKVTQ